MLEVVVSGLVTGWAIAIPIGAVGAFLVTLASRTSFRVGAAGALGIATVDGGYAALAVVAGSAVAAVLEPVAHALTIAAGVVLLAIAALTAVHAVGTAGRVRETRPMRPRGVRALPRHHRRQPDHGRLLRGGRAGQPAPDLVGRRAHLVTGLVSAVVIAGLALHTMLA